MYVAIQILASILIQFNEKLRRREEMPRTKTALVGLIVICLTLVTLTWILRGSLCELRVQGGHVLSLALTLAYESR